MWRSISTLLRPQEAYLTADNDYHQTSSSSTPISFSHSPSPVNLIPTGLHDPMSLFTRTNKSKKTKQNRKGYNVNFDNSQNPVTVHWNKYKFKQPEKDTTHERSGVTLLLSKVLSSKIVYVK